MSVKSFIALAGRRFMSALAHQTVSRTRNSGSLGRRTESPGIGESCDAIRRSMCVAVFAIQTTETDMLDGWDEVLSNRGISRTPRNVAFWTRH